MRIPDTAGPSDARAAVFQRFVNVPQAARRRQGVRRSPRRSWWPSRPHRRHSRCVPSCTTAGRPSRQSDSRRAGAKPARRRGQRPIAPRRPRTINTISSDSSTSAQRPSTGTGAGGADGVPLTTTPTSATHGDTVLSGTQVTTPAGVTVTALMIDGGGAALNRAVTVRTTSPPAGRYGIACTIAPVPLAAAQVAPPALAQVHSKLAMPAGTGSLTVRSATVVLPRLATVIV